MTPASRTSSCGPTEARVRLRDAEGYLETAELVQSEGEAFLQHDVID